MKILIFCFQVFLMLSPIIGNGQIDCENEQIELLRLDLEPTFQGHSIIQIECDSSNMILSFKRFGISGEELKNEYLKIPNGIYIDFKEIILGSRK